MVSRRPAASTASSPAASPLPPPDGQGPLVASHRARHLSLSTRGLATEAGSATVTIDESESPLAWLAARRGRDGQPLIAPHQFMAGERLRADFTRAHMMPRTTADWESPLQARGAGQGALHAAEAVVDAHRRVRQALDAVGPEFSGLLLDVCCFLKGLNDVEGERRWPARSAKLVLQLALESLARHYGLAGQARGPRRAEPRTWMAGGDPSGAGLAEG